MRRAVLVAGLCLAVLIVPASAQAPKPPAGMDVYLFGVLRRGNVPPATGTEADTLQRAHRENMGRMADAGLLVGAGPIGDQGDYRGIFIFKSGVREKVDAMLKDDPLIQSGRLALDLLTWWGPEKIGDAYFANKKTHPDADDKMVPYQLAFLLAGPNRKTESDPETERIQAGHMAHIRAMADAGQLVAAGPFIEEQRLRGIFVFQLDSVDAAKAVASQDPAVRAGRLVVDMHPWYVAEGVLPEPKVARGKRVAEVGAGSESGRTDHEDPAPSNLPGRQATPERCATHDNPDR